MNNTARVNTMHYLTMIVVATAIAAASVMHPAQAQPVTGAAQLAVNAGQALSARQLVIAPISAATAVGDMPRLNQALNEGLDAGLTLSETKEILVQMYAYAGFPRSLNGLGELMKVVEARKQRGVRDAPGREPGPVPKGQALLELGTANQTKLIGAPVGGPLYEFSPIIDEYLKSHLFGAMFARDNLDWQSRELATVGALAAMTGAESQLQSHVVFSMNVGLTAAQLRQIADVLAQRGYPEASERARAALARVEATRPQVSMTVNARRFTITLADTEAARAFSAMLPLTLDMPDLNRNEKHVELPKALPANASQPGTIRSGDLMLYGSRTLVLFYLTFDSPYSYTRLGRVDDAEGLARLLGRGSARIAFSRD